MARGWAWARARRGVTGNAGLRTCCVVLLTSGFWSHPLPIPYPFLTHTPLIPPPSPPPRPPVAERALAAIHYREEGEKFNVWLAWLNLENSYGTPDPAAALMALFNRALQVGARGGRCAGARARATGPPSRRAAAGGAPARLHTSVARRLPPPALSFSAVASLQRPAKAAARRNARGLAASARTGALPRAPPLPRPSPLPPPLPPPTCPAPRPLAIGLPLPQYTDQKKLYIALLGILQRSGRGQLVDDALRAMTKKFGGSCKARARAARRRRRARAPL
jgi:hypothetical protein